MSESAWNVIIKAYQRELEQAKTPEEKARWQAAIDQSLTEANKEAIIAEGSVRQTPEQKAGRVKAAKTKKAMADYPRLVEEGKIKVFPPGVPVPEPVSGKKDINKIINSTIDDLDEIYDTTHTIPDDSYIASLVDAPDSIIDDVDGYIDDVVEYIDEVNPFDVDDISGPQKLDALNVVVDDLTSGAPTAAKKAGMFPELTARVKSAIDQSIDLAVDISNDISKGASAGGAVISSAKKTASTAARAAGSTDTAKSVIQSMKKARTVVSGMSTAKKTGITLGALGTIGAFSSNSRDRRRN